MEDTRRAHTLATRLLCPATGLLSALLLVGMLQFTTGCASTKSVSGLPYFEEAQDGNIYVMGNEATHEAFSAGQALASSKSMENAGPNGETVVIEVDEDVPEMADRLWLEFQLNHGL